MTKKKKIIIWDVDGVKYNYNAPSPVNFYELCDEADAVAAMKLMPGLKYDEAIELGRQSYSQYSDCYGAFLPHAETYGVDPDKLRLDLFKEYHSNLYTMVMARDPAFFDHAKNGVAEEFKKGQSNIQHGALSHSCMEGWGKNILQLVGTLPYYQENALWGMDQFNFVRKGESAEPLKKIIELFDNENAEIWFVEDTMKNIEVAKETMPHVKMAYIHQSRKVLDKLPSHVDYQAATPLQLMRYMNAA